MSVNISRDEKVQSTLGVVEVPESCYDSITMELMVDPVQLPCGQTIDRSTAIACISRDGKCPFTRDKLELKDLNQNIVLRDIINDYKKKGAVASRRVISSDAKGSDAVGIEEIKLTSSKFMNRIVTKLQVPDTETRKRVHIIGVKDISGSMRTQVMGTNATGEKENDGSTLSDLVNQGLKSVVNCLEDGDLFTFIEFSNTATVTMDPTKMDTSGRSIATTSIDNSRPDGGTNIWGGVKEALDVARANYSTEILTKIMIFTDGCSNYKPPQGEVGALKSYCEKNGGYPCSIDYVGFGSGDNIDTKMGYELSSETGGRGYYISDGSMIGNVFSNAEGLMLSCIAYNANIYYSIETPRDSTKYPEFNLEDLARKGYNPKIIDRNTICIETGPLIYGSERHFSIPLKSDFKLENVKVTFQKDNFTTESLNSEGLDISFWKEYHFKINYLDILTELTYFASIHNFTKVKEILDKYKSENSGGFVMSFFTRDNYDDIRNLLLKDINGEITLALEESNYRKWGKHYLPLLKDAHVFEYANNFKDESCQIYVSKFFDKNREMAIDNFEKIPLIPTGDVYRSPGGYNLSSVPRQIDTSLYGRGAGCFHGLSTVERIDPLTDVILCHDLPGPQIIRIESVPIKNIRPGDMIKCGGNMIFPKYSKVEKILVTRIEHGKLEMVELDNGWIGTPNHPVKKDGKWIHPKDLSDTIFIDCDATYSFLLEDRNSSVFVNGLESITLAHRQSGDVAEHDFFGTERIVDCMNNISKIMGYHNNIVTVEQKWFERNASGLISLIEPTTVGELLDTKGWHVDKFMKVIPESNDVTFENLVRRPIIRDGLYPHIPPSFVGDGLDSHHIPSSSVLEAVLKSKKNVTKAC